MLRTPTVGLLLTVIDLIVRTLVVRTGGSATVVNENGKLGGQPGTAVVDVTFPLAVMAVVFVFVKFHVIVNVPFAASAGYGLESVPVIDGGNPVSVAVPATAGEPQVSLIVALTVKLVLAGTLDGVVTTLLNARQQGAAVTVTPAVAELFPGTGSVVPDGGATVAVLV